MKSRIFVWIIGMTLFTLLAMPVRIATDVLVSAALWGLSEESPRVEPTESVAELNVLHPASKSSGRLTNARRRRCDITGF